MNISDMNREQLAAHMKSNGTIHRPSKDSAEWKHAFKLIRKAGYENLEMDCQKCFNKVHTWISETK